MNVATTIALAIFGATGFWALVTEVFRWWQNKKKGQVNPADIELMKSAILAILYDRLYQACRFYLSKGRKKYLFATMGIDYG